ncbi:hypothetical protein ACFQV8_00555 [Pseudonocardia benzenivorans]
MQLAKVGALRSRRRAAAAEHLTEASRGEDHSVVKGGEVGRDEPVRFAVEVDEVDEADRGAAGVTQWNPICSSVCTIRGLAISAPAPTFRW